MEPRLNENPASFTYDSEVNAYYFRPTNRTPPPYLKQKEVTAILDIASDGTLAGIELVFGIDFNPPPGTVALGTDIEDDNSSVTVEA